MALSTNLKRAMAVGVCVAALAACGRGGESSDDSSGFTDDEIILGANAPLSGPAAGFAGVTYGARAYFKYLNDTDGGVTMADGRTRKIKFIVRDDGYDPARALGVVKTLVEEDQVAALVEPFGTDPNLATRPYLNKKRVPQIFVQSTNPRFNTERADYPYSMTGSASSVVEAAVLARYAVQAMPEAKIAMLRANDEGGEAYGNAFKKAIQGSSATIVEEQTYATTDASIDSQLSILARTRADVFVNFATPKFAALAISRVAELGWKPVMLLPSQASSVKAVLEPAGLDNAKGAITVGWFKDPTDPQWVDDQSMKDFRDAIAQYESAADPNDSFVAAGWGVAEAFVQMLEKVEPSREALREAINELDGETGSMLLPGVEFHTSPDDPFGIEALWIQEFNGKNYTFVGDEPISLEGESSALVGEE